MTVAFFIATVASVSILELARSYRTAFDVAFTEAELSGYLVSEWISESFSGIDYILKDALYGFDQHNILSASRTADERARINERLVRMAAYREDMIFLGLFDTDCVIQYGSIQEIIGDSSAELQRAYCDAVLEAPIQQMKLSGFFISSTGDMNVSATYPLVVDDNEVAGFSLAALDLSFFQRWLNSLSNPAITISIMDANQILLARKPKSNQVGEQVEDDRLAKFLQTGDDSVLFRRASPVDRIERLWSIRRTRNLPFVVAVGYALDDVLAAWRTKILAYLIGNLLVATISLFLALAYHRNRANAQAMETLAMTDPLTGQMNRRSFTKAVKARLKEVPSKQQGDAALIMIDVDHFKTINDSLGHDAGDSILTQLADELKACFRSSDLICRWGGEEFLAFVADADLETAKTLAARLQARLAKRQFLDGLTVSVSQGIATLEAQDSFELAIKRADDRLYAAKASGRNCFRFA
ncbi:GGDEF domain-containing protein [Thiorhodovibrio frisius]|uniref:GGDEF domain-containing protein n=1 Tax=Thiorhodovibrio frisius TaxID=631362 RepID=UPI00167F2E7D|nr:diguanylate cyclase [Thiorhodovibrio frisius]